LSLYRGETPTVNALKGRNGRSAVTGKTPVAASERRETARFLFKLSKTIIKGRENLKKNQGRGNQSVSREEGFWFALKEKGRSPLSSTGISGSMKKEGTPTGKGKTGKKVFCTVNGVAKNHRPQK